MLHPRLPKHEVICPGVPAAKLWLENFFEEQEEDGETKQRERSKMRRRKRNEEEDE